MYFLTTIPLANLLSPGSTNEAEAAGLSETATTIPLRKPKDDIPRPQKPTIVCGGSGGRREKGGVPESLYLSRTFPGKIKNAN